MQYRLTMNNDDTVTLKAVTKLNRAKVSGTVIFSKSQLNNVDMQQWIGLAAGKAHAKLDRMQKKASYAVGEA